MAFLKHNSGLLFLANRNYSVVTIECANFCTNHKLNRWKSSNDGPVERLRHKIENGELMSDSHQTRVAESLQRVYQDLQHYNAPKSSIFNKWFQSEKVYSPNGLYLYGSVGGGKTMLMDLFYDCCRVINHFIVFLKIIS